MTLLDMIRRPDTVLSFRSTSGIDVACNSHIFSAVTNCIYVTYNQIILEYPPNHGAAHKNGCAYTGPICSKLWCSKEASHLDTIVVKNINERKFFVANLCNLDCNKNDSTSKFQVDFCDFRSVIVISWN